MRRKLRGSRVMNMRNVCMQSLLIFVKELRYRLYFIPLSLLVSWLLPLLYGSDPNILETYVILLPLILSATLFRGSGEQELLVASAAPFPYVFAARVAATYLVTMVPLTISVIWQFGELDPAKYAIVFVALTAAATAFTVLWRCITGSSIGSALLAVATLLFFQHVIRFRGFARNFQLYRSMGLASNRLFWRSRWYIIIVSVLIVAICSWLLRFKERRGKSI